MKAPLKLGIAGWGVAGKLMAEAVARSDRFSIAGVADQDPERQRAALAAGVPRVHATTEALAAEPTVEVLYLATPTEAHAAGISAAAAAGKHVIVEKPLAASVEMGLEAIRMAEAAGIVVIVGATRSFDSPVRAFRNIVVDGVLGSLLALTNYCSTDWLSRPRRPVDYDAERGGGLVFRQGTHQFDLMRYIGGGLVHSVRAHTVSGADGSVRGYAAMLTFVSGMVGTAVYNGAGGFDSRLLTFGIGELGERLAVPEDDPRRDFIANTPTQGAPPGSAPPFFGFTIATFEHGDVVPSPRGLLCVRREGVEDIFVEPYPSGWDAVLAEMADTLDGAPAVHDGRWGLATLEVCAAVYTSSRTANELTLKHQVPLPTISSSRP